MARPGTLDADTCGAIPGSDLAALLARVEAAEGADRELDGAIALALCDEHRFMQLADAPLGAGCEMYRFGTHGFHSALRVTASLDASLALKNRVLPGYAMAAGDMAFEGSDRRPWGCVWNAGGFIAGQAEAKTPALALLAAMLKALIAQGEADTSDRLGIPGKDQS